MTQEQIKTRIEEINTAIMSNLTSGNNSVESAIEWAKLQDERSALKQLIS